MNTTLEVVTDRIRKRSEKTRGSYLRHIAAAAGPSRRAMPCANLAHGVPAMCDGVTQGREGMELSLFSRDLIAQATAAALSHDMFDAGISA